jgi:hypothetical protein
MRENPVIVSYFGTDPIGKILSNFHHSPFILDGQHFASCEGFWQGLKTINPEHRIEIAGLYGLEAKKAGHALRGSVQFVVYAEGMYKVASEAHHRLLERALRSKFIQHEESQLALKNSGNRPLRHMILNRFGQFRTGDSPALPAIVFERMLTDIRFELLETNMIQNLPIPAPL